MKKQRLRWLDDVVRMDVDTPALKVFDASMQYSLLEVTEKRKNIPTPLEVSCEEWHWYFQLEPNNEKKRRVTRYY